MHALHQTLLPPSAIHHSLYLPNFTPSTIYPYPRPHDLAPDVLPVRVTGNLVVAGGEDLRVFEIREETVARSLADAVKSELNGHAVDLAAGTTAEEEEAREGMEDDFYDNGPSAASPIQYETRQYLNLVARHALHGTVTGLAALRTIESGVDGLDRLLVSFRDAKMAILEWSRGDISTVSLHTYERCQPMTQGDVSNYVPRLRADPLSRIALLTLPEDSLAVLPVLQEQSELDPLFENFPRDVPYSPSFVLSLPEVSASLKNLHDLLFLPGFHSPTLALLYSPTMTWAGRYQSVRDTFCLEIRTIDLSSGGSYPLLTSVTRLPSDSIYMVACPAELGGVVVVTQTGLIHIDQSGRTICAGVSAWWSYATARPADPATEDRQLSLDGSKAVFVDSRNMLLVLSHGDVHQVRFELDGRMVGAIKIDEQSSEVPPPSSVIVAGDRAVFVGSADGDSILAKVDFVADKMEAVNGHNTVEEDVKPPEPDMEVDWDEDLYGDRDAPAANGVANGISHNAVAGPSKIRLAPHDTLSGVGKILDIEFGIAVTEQGQRTYPQLVVSSGGTRRSTLNVFRRGIPITKRRRFNELAKADGVWFLPVQRQGAPKFKNIPDHEVSTMLFSSEVGQTRIFALSTRATPEQIGRIGSTTIAAGTFFQRSNAVHISPRGVLLYNSEGKVQQTVYQVEDEGVSIVGGSISDPYIVIRRSDDSVLLFVGDTVSRTISLSEFGSEAPSCHSVAVFRDRTGVYRTFEAVQASLTASRSPDTSRRQSQAPARVQTTRTQISKEQIKRLQDEKPAISVEAPSMESAMNAAMGTQWLALLTASGTLQIRSLPDLNLVLETYGLTNQEPSFSDDLDPGAAPSPDEAQDPVKQLLFAPVGAAHPRPHLLILHESGRLNAYEAQPRFTLDASQSTSRRSLAVRFRKVHTMLLPLDASTKLQYTLVPFSNIEGVTGAFITGEKPHWIISNDAHPIKAVGLKQAAMAFAKTTHLGGQGEYFIRIEDGSFICYLPPSLNMDFAMPCDRYQMSRVYTNIAFDPPSGHYVGATALTRPFQAYDEEGEIQLGPEGPNLIPPINEQSSLELFSRGSDPWRVIDGYDFDQNEQVLCMESVTLESTSQPGGFRDFIAVGTGFDFAEDRASRGNLYVFEVVEMVAADPKTSGWTLVKRTKDPARNPVSSLTGIGPYILHSNGPKVYAKGFDDDERVMGLAFLDVNLYVTTMKTFKNFILIGDLVKSIWFCSLQDDPYKFTIIAKDLAPVSVITADFLVQEGQVTFIMVDKTGVMRTLDFDPADTRSAEGERLLLRTEYYLGALPAVSKVIARRRTTEEEYAPQSQIIHATADGALTTLVSVKPARFKRLQLVSDQLVRNAQHVAGLNPRAYRTVKNDLTPKALSRGILDGGLLEGFSRQPLQRQREMMRQIGTDEVTVASDLQALGGFW